MECWHPLCGRGTFLRRETIGWGDSTSGSSIRKEEVYDHGLSVWSVRLDGTKQKSRFVRGPMMSLVLILKCLWGIYQVFMLYTAQGLLEYINTGVHRVSSILLANRSGAQVRGMG